MQSSSQLQITCSPEQMMRASAQERVATGGSRAAPPSSRASLPLHGFLILPDDLLGTRRST